VLRIALDFIAAARMRRVASRANLLKDGIDALSGENVARGRGDNTESIRG
jgi:hypothetical protein